MSYEDDDYQKFMAEFVNKVGELKEKFNKLSHNNKRRFYAEVKPVLDTEAFRWLFGKKR